MPQIKTTEEITISALANHLSLSTATISKALRGVGGVNEKTARRVITLADKLGYKPNVFARGLKNKKSNVIGFLLTTELTNSWYAELVSCVEARLQKAGYTLMLTIGNRDENRERTCLDIFASSFLDGLIAGPIFTHSELGPFMGMVGNGTPFVTFANVEDLPTNYVNIDHVAGVKKAIHYLVQCGHIRIGYLCCTPRVLRQSQTERKAGFDEAIIECGLTLNGRDIIMGDTSFESGFYNMKKLIEERRDDLPTAFFCHNDEPALGAIEALHSKGMSVPDDISIIGYDGVKRAAYSTPALTTVGGIMEQLADKLEQTLFNVIDQKSHDLQKCSIEPQLIIRHSVKKV